MKPQGRFHPGRIAAFFMIGALVLLSVGDRAFAVISRGIDPLDTLDRTAKPNVVLVLDNSSSMRTSPYFNGGVGPGTGDWSLSKLAVAKSTIATAIANNQSRANFMLASFQQATTPAVTTGSDRFYYVLSDTSGAPPAFAATPFTNYTWQQILATRNTLYWTESSGSAPINPVITIGAGSNDKIYIREARQAGQEDRYRTCTWTLPASLYGSHGNGTADPNFATLITGINAILLASNGTARSCATNHGSVNSTPDNDYSLSFNGATFKFTLNADPAGAGSGTPQQYQLLFGSGTLLDDLGFPTSLPQSGLTTTFAGGPPPTAANYQTLANNVGADVSTVGIVNPVACSASLAPAFYASGFTLATDLAAAMLAAKASCTPTIGTNTYSVTFDPASGVFTFARVGVGVAFSIQWSTGGLNNIAGVLGRGGAADSSFSTSTASGATTKLADYQGVNSQTTDLIGATTRTNYTISAGRFFNGDRLSLDATGAVCAVAAGGATSPPTLNVLASVAGCGDGAASTFTLAGANWGDDVSGTAGIPGSGSCTGYRSVVNLVACNTATPQTTTFATALSPGLTLNPGSPFSPTGYNEATDGSYRALATPTAAGLIAFESNAPMASTINGVRGAFNTLYSAGNFGLTAISSHSQPRERTIVVMITDGQDTCAIDLGSGTDNNALAAAYQAELLYRPISGSLNPDGTYVLPGSTTDVASSVSTYVVGFGNGINTAIDTNRLNWIAWGGSGLGLNSFTPMSNNGTRWNSIPTASQRELCATCNDAFIALDGTALQTVLQAVIDQATSSEGVFSATQAIQASPFELADVVTGVGSLDPETRYDVLAPLGFESIFTMPGFRGTIRAISNQGGVPTVFWDAGQKLLSGSTNSIQTTMNLAIPAGSSPTGVVGEGSFTQLHNGALDTNVRLAPGVGIRRRIYTTAGNGTFPVIDNQFATLFAGTSPCRVPLWPPNSAPSGPTGSCVGNGTVAPADDSTEGVLDVALGLPSDAQIAADPITTFNSMQSYYEVCVASPPAIAMPPGHNCISATPATKALRARREARETILAYIAGASVVLDTAGYPKRATTTSPGKWAIGDIVYHARSWAMSESTLSSAAVVGPPIEITPGTTGFVEEYNQYRDGPRNASNVAVDGILKGFGLRNPDQDSTTSSGGDDGGRPALKPIMTAVYVGANDMLHAFRAGPNCNIPATNFSGCAEQGGEELWGFVPFDRLTVLRALLKPQTRGNKTYVIASGVRFADAFINAPGGNFNITIGGVVMTGRGVWRQVLTFGRGQGGKYYTVLDVTGRGPFTGRALDTPGPIVMWSRGNPDTVDGTPSGQANGNGADTAAYSKMGETWSVPAISFVDKNQNNGTSVVLYTGSGYGDSANPGEGTFFYTLDALTGSVIGSIDVEAAASANGVTRSGLSYPNALVAGPAAYSANQLKPLQAGHPSEITTRVFFGDLHGRLWKVNSSLPNTAVLMADLGANQAVGVPPALIALGLPANPHIFATSGNDSRAAGPFKTFAFKDDSGSDSNTSPGTRTPSSAPAPLDDLTVFEYPPQSKSLFVRPLAAADGTQFRGTIQPATAFTDSTPPNGRVFFGGTRFTGFNSTIPCLATFDTIIFALGAETGGAAYDLSSSGDDAYVVFSNSRKLAIQVIRQPGATPGSTSQPAKLYLDEGLMSGTTSPNPPAPAGFSAEIVPTPPSVMLAARSGGGGPTATFFPQYSTPRICQ
jgi:hypothetical protein